MVRNIGPASGIPNAAPGAVAASPSRDPYYRYHWIRDAALVMNTVFGLYERSSDPVERARYSRLLAEYVDFSRRNQLTSNPSGGADGLGLGEPKFEIDGSAYNDPWGRPQNDGPALRAITLIRLAYRMLAEGQGSWVRQKLYDPSLPGGTVIKTDLEFVSHHWRDSSFDIWEEVRGDHFYTRMTQRRALVEGAALAERMGDLGAAHWYRQQAGEIQDALEEHWDPGQGFLQVTLRRTAGLDYKHSGLDVAVVLGALHSLPIPGTRGRRAEAEYFGVTDDRVLATAERIAEAFKQVFPINGRDRDWDNHPMGIAIGRYPEDRYSGVAGQNEGHGWFLATNAFAELYYRAAARWESEGRIQVTPVNSALFRRLKVYSARLTTMAGETIRATDPRFHSILRGLRLEGDSFLRRSRFHADPSGALSEQFNRHSGYMQSAEELTWSHASVLTAAWARGE